MVCPLFIILKNKNKLVLNSLKNKRDAVPLNFIILPLKTILNSVETEKFFDNLN